MINGAKVEADLIKNSKNRKFNNYIAKAFQRRFRQELVNGKVDVEWNIMFNDGVVATIYNWKNGPASMGTNGTNPVDIKTWHIGGKTISAVYDIEEMLQK